MDDIIFHQQPKKEDEKAVRSRVEEVLHGAPLDERKRSLWMRHLSEAPVEYSLFFLSLFGHESLYGELVEATRIFEEHIHILKEKGVNGEEIILHMHREYLMKKLHEELAEKL